MAQTGAVLHDQSKAKLRRQQQQQQQQRNSVPHMAVMEAVVTSVICHPNVVQVYTYMLTPLMLQNIGLGVGRNGPEPTTEDAAAAETTGLDEGSSNPGRVFDFQLHLVMGFCDKICLLCWETVWGVSRQIRREVATLLLGDRGDDCCRKSGGNAFKATLRESLDRRLLPCLLNSPMPDPGVVLSISHDVAAAMLHLHTEGIVHGDLKAGNVLLTLNTAPGCQKAGSTGQGSSSSSRSSAERG